MLKAKVKLVFSLTTFHKIFISQQSVTTIFFRPSRSKLSEDTRGYDNLTQLLTKSFSIKYLHVAVLAELFDYPSSVLPAVCQSTSIQLTNLNFSKFLNLKVN